MECHGNIVLHADEPVDLWWLNPWFSTQKSTMEPMVFHGVPLITLSRGCVCHASYVVTMGYDNNITV